MKTPLTLHSKMPIMAKPCCRAQNLQYYLDPLRLTFLRSYSNTSKLTLGKENSIKSDTKKSETKVSNVCIYHNKVLKLLEDNKSIDTETELKESRKIGCFRRIPCLRISCSRCSCARACREKRKSRGSLRL